MHESASLGVRVCECMRLVPTLASRGVVHLASAALAATMLSSYSSASARTVVDFSAPSTAAAFAAVDDRVMGGACKRGELAG